MSDETETSNQSLYDVPTFKDVIIRAVQENDTGVIRDFHNRGIDLTNSGGIGSLIHYACFYRNFEMLELGIQLGVDINALDSRGSSPLHICLVAAFHYDEHKPFFLFCINFLLQAGADVNITCFGLTVLRMYINITPRVYVVAKLLKLGHMVTCLHVEKDILPKFHEEDRPTVVNLLHAAGAYCIEKMLHEISEARKLKEPQRLDCLAVKFVRKVLQNHRRTNLFKAVERIPDMLTPNKPFPKWLRQILTCGIKLEDYFQ